MDIETYLKTSGKSQKDLADQLGITRSAVNQWIKGTTHPSGKQAAEIIRISGGLVTIDDIYPVNEAA